MENDERAIRALVDTWLNATQAGDLETVLHLMSDDVVFLVAGQPPMIGKVAFTAAATAQPGGERPRFEGSSEIEELKVLGDWAFMRTKLSVTMTPSGGRSVTRSGYTLSILKKHEGRWLWRVTLICSPRSINAYAISLVHMAVTSAGENPLRALHRRPS